MSHLTWAQEILQQYPAPLRGDLVFLGNHGGFSGALLWRLSNAVGTYCLKAYPQGWRSPEALASIHALLESAAALPWLPQVMQTSAGATFACVQGRHWEITSWLPGCADFLRVPSVARLQSVCTALAQLHETWQPRAARTDVCPAVQRRWDSLLTWQHLRQSGWRPLRHSLDPYYSITEPLWQLVTQHIDEVPRLLTPWLVRALPLQPCVCDLWHDHVLYTDENVTGLIDFGSVKEDHVAVDLARLLGSLVGADEEMWTLGLAAYERIRPLAAEERQLARDLDRTGTILAATHWLRWLYQERRSYDRPSAVLQRLTHLLGRLQTFLQAPG